MSKDKTTGTPSIKDIAKGVKDKVKEALKPGSKAIEGEEITGTVLSISLNPDFYHVGFKYNGSHYFVKTNKLLADQLQVGKDAKFLKIGDGMDGFIAMSQLPASPALPQRDRGPASGRNSPDNFSLYGKAGRF